MTLSGGQICQVPGSSVVVFEDDLFAFPAERFQARISHARPGSLDEQVCPSAQESKFLLYLSSRGPVQEIVVGFSGWRGNRFLRWAIVRQAA